MSEWQIDGKKYFPTRQDLSLHTQAEVISSEQQPLLLPCLPLQYILLKASLQDQRSPSQALPKQQFAAAMQGFTSH